jgi:hypothetical protein
MWLPGLVAHCVEESVVPNFPKGFYEACASHYFFELVERQGFRDSRESVFRTPEPHAKQSSTENLQDSGSERVHELHAGALRATTTVRASRSRATG